MKVKIFGDHSGTHCGCVAVMDSLKDLLKNKYEICLEGDEDYDILIVNGEGSMHHNSINFKGKMEQIKNAIENGKRAFLINSVWQKNPPDYDVFLKKIGPVVVREKASHDDLLKNHSISSIVRLDLSYQAEINRLENYVDLKNKDVLTDFYSADFGAWVRYSGGSRSKLPYLDMKKFSWSSLVMTLETAGLLITGRHHAVFAACRAKTPFVALESNTHKISGFIEMSKIPIPVCRKASGLTAAIKWAKENKNAYQEFFAFIDEQPRFVLADIGL